MSDKKDLVKKGGLVVDERPDWMKTDGNRGSEEVGNNDVQLPRLQIIQDLSPQHKKTKEEYIEGAEVGDFFNTVSQELFKGAKLFVPVYFKIEYVIWKDQKAGGGFFGAFDTELEAKKELPVVLKENGGNPDDYEVVMTNVHFVLVIDETASTTENPVLEQAVLSMSKSQNKVSRHLNSMVRMAGGDRFSRVYELSTFVDKNNAGQEFMNWRVKTKGWVSEAIYKIAEATYDAIKSGERKVNYGEQQEGQSEAKAEENVDTSGDEFAV